MNLFYYFYRATRHDSLIIIFYDIKLKVVLRNRLKIKYGGKVVIKRS